MRLLTGFRFLLVAGVGPAVACGTDRVAVRVTIPDDAGVETPLAGVRVTFHPYDRDSVLEELASRASPRPSTARLDSLFQAFRTPFTAYLRLNAALDRLRQSPDPTQADSLVRLERELEAARAVLAGARQRLQPEIDSLRQVLLAWEDSAFRTYDSVSAALTRRRGIVFDTTGVDGWLEVRLPAGPWWAVARAVNVQDPYAEWYWNLPARRGDTVLLNPGNGRTRPRYR